ncbi:MAG: hypothetical protein VZR11_09950 [Succinimonas sp.]|nr:hypothetical protein [Succinimonas sp.]
MTDTVKQNLPAQNIKEAQEISSGMNTSLFLHIVSYFFVPLFFLTIPKVYKLAFRAWKLLEAAGDNAASLEAETVYKLHKLKWNLFLGMIFGGIGMGVLSWVLSNEVGHILATLYGVFCLVCLAFFIYADVTAMKKRFAIKGAIDKIGG